MTGFELDDRVVVVGEPSGDVRVEYTASYVNLCNECLGHVGTVTKVDRSDPVLTFRIEFDADVHGHTELWMEGGMIQRIREDEL